MAAVTIEGSAAFLRNVRRFAARVPQACAPAVREQAELTLAAAQATVPKASGQLAQSAFVDGPQLLRDGPAATCGYTAPYAAYEHEGFHGHAQIDSPPKWLEAAVGARSAGLLDAVQASLQSLFSGA